MKHVDDKSFRSTRRLSVCIYLLGFVLPNVTVGQSLRYEQRFYQIADSAIYFFAKKENLCYRFQEKRDGSNFKRPIYSFGEVRVIKTNGEIYYRGTNNYYFDSLKASPYDFIKSPEFFGVNVIVKNTFKNYKALKKDKQYFGFNYSDKNVLKPDSSIYRELFDPTFIKDLKVLQDRYLLELKDTTRHPFKGVAEGYRFNTLHTFEISKTDYALLSFSRQVSSYVEHVLTYETSVQTYTFFTNAPSEILRSIRSFSPMPEEPLTNSLVHDPDTSKIFPAIQLPDSSGKLNKPNTSLKLVDFWYKACAPCLANMKYLHELKRDGLEIVLINIKDSPSDKQVKQLMNTYPFQYFFEGNNLAKRLNVSGYPTMFLVDEQHAILYRHTGAGGSDELIELLDKKLKVEKR